MKLRFQRRLGSAALALATITFMSCGSGTDPVVESSSTESTPSQTASQETSDSTDAPEGLVAECAAVQKVLDDSFNNGFGATLSSDSGTIKADDSVLAASVAAATAADGMDDALDDAKDVLEGLTAITISDAELLGYRDAYIEQLNALIPELDSAKSFYQSVDEALDADEPNEAQATVVQESFTRTGTIAETIETMADELEDIDQDVFDYCLDAELDDKFGE